MKTNNKTIKRFNKRLEHVQKQSIRVLLLSLSVLTTSLAFAHSFEVDGIYYRVNGHEAIVTCRGTSYYQYDNEYSGDVTIPSIVSYDGVTYSVTSIDSHSFQNCSGLTNITIPNSITNIGSSAFQQCSGLTSVTIPNSVIEIGEYVFVDCSGLISVKVASDNLFYDSRGNCNAIIETSSNTLIAGCKNSFIESTVISIGHHAFYGCTGLSSVNIPSSVTSIGQCAFSNCTGLTNVFIPNSVTTIGSHAFGGCSCLTSIDIPNSVIEIGEYAFSGCTSLTNANLGNSVSTIEDYVFNYCTNLKSIVIPNSVTSVGQGAFRNCTSLTNATLGNSVSTIGDNVFINCTNLKSIVIPNSVTSVGQGAFRNCTSLTNATIGNSVISIGSSAFLSCRNLVNVKLPRLLKSIGKSAFSGCYKLSEVAFPISLTSIGDSAFYQCQGLENILIPNAVTSIGDYAFHSCTGLKSATVTSHLTSLGIYAFYKCSALVSFTCMPETPPIFINSSSFNTYNTTNLYVPRSGVENYKTHNNWRRFAKIYEFVGYFTVPDINVSKGKTVVVPVSMTNEADIIGFQTDIYLPEGFEFVKDGADYIVDPSDRMARDHSIMCNISEDGALRVLCFSPTNKLISGNEGELFYVTIKAPADSVGDFSLCFKNTILTTSDAEELLSPDAYTNINVIPYLPGDANGNGEVSVIDIVTAAQYIIFQNPDPFLFEAADLNNDDQITVTDLALIANLILYPTMSAPKRMPKRMPTFDLSDNQIHGNDIQLNVGETQTVTITLDNMEEYSAFQMDIKMPCGLTASSFRMADQSGSHIFITSEEREGIIRVLCYSPSLAAFGNDEKALLTFDVTATGNIVGDIIIDGIELVTTTCQPVHLDAIAITVNQSNTVNEVSSGKNASQIEYYNLAGQKLAKPTQGVTIVVTTYTDGSRSAQKVVL